MAGRGLEGFFSLSRNINKARDKTDFDSEEGVISDLIPELKLGMSDTDLSDLAKEWKKKWEDSELRSTIKRKQEDNENYWLGKQFQHGEGHQGHLSRGGLDHDRPNIDNIIFEAEETMLPIVTKKNPEPVVLAENTAQGIQISNKVNKTLIYLADILKFRITLKTVARNWGLYFLGVGKVGWSEINNEISFMSLRPQKLVLDPDATIVNGKYTGEYLGEHKDDSAGDLIKRFPSKKKFIRDLVDGNMGTKLQYIEWWSDTILFWSMGEEILDKIKNPHWNYAEEGQPDEFGQLQQAKPRNHLPAPTIPYMFLSVFNIGKHPYDDTGLISQNISQQDRINRRHTQIDDNSNNINGGWAISGEKSGLTKEEASRFIKAIRKGGAAWIPKGSIQEAIQKVVGSSLPGEVFNDLVDTRNEVRNSFGIRGSSPQGTISEKTVRGKILTQGQDTSRNAFISDYLEQFSDDVYNYFVQMMYVYYDEEHTASIIGRESAAELVSLQADEFQGLERKLRVISQTG